MGNSSIKIPNNHKKVLIALLTLLGVVYWFAFNFLRIVEFDTPSFIGAARLLFGLEGGYNFQSRLSKPLVLILPGLFEYLFGLHPKYMLLAQNIIAYFILAFLLYKTTYLLTGCNKKALLAVLAYYMCNPFAVYSLFYLVDAVGWLAGIWVIYLGLKFFQHQPFTYKKLLFLGFLSGLGMLCKESAIIGIVFLVSFIFVKSAPFAQKLNFILLTTLAFLLPFLLSNLITQYYFGVSVFQRVSELQISEGALYYNKNNIQQVFRIIDVYWLLLAFGVWHFIKYYKSIQQKQSFQALVLMLGLSLLTMPVYPYIVDRILFMIAPVLIVFVAIGAYQFKTRAYFLIVVGGIINVVITWAIYSYNTSGMLRNGLIIYGVLLLISEISIRRKAVH